MMKRFSHMKDLNKMHVIPAVLSLSLRKQGRESTDATTPGFLTQTFRNDTTSLFRWLNLYELTDFRCHTCDSRYFELMDTCFRENEDEDK